MKNHIRKPDWAPRASDVLERQIESYDAMRRQCPVAWSDYQHWSLFRHQDVMTALEDHETFSSVVSAHLSVPNGMDPPEHTPYRKVIESYFSDEAMAAFEPRCRAIARTLVRSLPLNESFDLVHTFSQAFALQIQCAFMGWPDSYHAPLRQWVQDNHQATLARDRPAMARLARQFEDYILQLLESRRQAGEQAPDDNTTRLMREAVNGRLMTDEELISLMRNWTVGELGTISSSVSIVVNYLAHNPELQTRLRDNTGELPAAIDEILRMDAPLISNRRVTTREVSLGGRTLPAGERVTILWASANRDEAVFDDPDAFCPQQNQKHNLLYGAGVHICPGAPLARMELRVLFEELLAHAELAHAPDAKAVRAHFPAGGFRQLPVVVTRRPAT